MIKQSVKGLRSKSIAFIMSDGDATDLASILAGKIEVFEEVATGGTPLTMVPNPINKQTYSCFKKGVSGTKKSTRVSFCHIKPAKQFMDVYNALINKFDTGYEPEAIKCDCASLVDDQ